MTIIDIPTERTTALTDLILGILLVIGFISLYRLEGRKDSLKIKIWLAAFGLLGFASFLGAIAHGLAWSEDVYFWLWQPLNLALGLVIAMFVCAAVYDRWGAGAARKVMLPMVGVAAAFYLVTVLIPGTFLTFVAYEALAMLFALVVYGYLALQKRLAGAGWMVAGVLVTIIAAAVQALGVKGTVIFWGLDNNGVFHLIQMAGVLALSIGVHRSLSKEAASIRQPAV